MPVFRLDRTPGFPDPSFAEEDGLLAVGGGLTEEWLLLAYKSGIFPWYTYGGQPFWFSPDPRYVLFPSELRVSKSMKVLLKRNAFRFTVNQAFTQVIEKCAKIPREGQPGSWISPDMMRAYVNMHEKGHAVSAESWEGDRLVGGLYGLWLPPFFFGESMFAEVSNASKYAFILFVRHLAEQGTELIDCQVETPHLMSLGARPIRRDSFIGLLRDAYGTMH
jgi:leucyl/phenylalanyl-tRNA--protein transferase